MCVANMIVARTREVRGIWILPFTDVTTDRYKATVLTQPAPYTEPNYDFGLDTKIGAYFLRKAKDAC